MPGRRVSKKASKKASKKVGVKNTKGVTVTCLKCKKKVELLKYTKKTMKNGTTLVKGECPKGCKTKDGKVMKVAGFVGKDKL
jgi:hypothetical protein